jgi:hypothetical protein
MSTTSERNPPIPVRTVAAASRRSAASWSSPRAAAASAPPATANDAAASSCTRPSWSAAAMRCRSSCDASNALCIIAIRCAWARRVRRSNVHRIGTSSTNTIATLLSVTPTKPRHSCELRSVTTL